jgi:hypothetical protein
VTVVSGVDYFLNFRRKVAAETGTSSA